MKATKRYVDLTGRKRIESLADAAICMKSLFDEWNISADRSKSLWFRGQANFDWGLLPGLYRPGNNSFFEREVVRDFKLHAPRYLTDLPSTGLGWISLMQHYGLPTRLLDWSESYLIALFFALRGNYGHDDAALWVMRPAYLNSRAFGVHGIPVETDPVFNDYVLPEPHMRVKEVSAALPAAFRPIWNSARIASQRGTFTIHGREKRGLEEVLQEMYDSGYKAQALKVRIPFASRDALLKELKMAGITELTLFPEMSALCKEIEGKYLK